MNKVLIVDDHPVIRLAVRMLMERHGYDVVAETDNGVAALQLTRQHLPDIVVLDIGIPRLDGLEVIARMATFSPGSKVLVLTSQAPGNFSMRCMQAGASGYVQAAGAHRIAQRHQGRVVRVQLLPQPGLACVAWQGRGSETDMVNRLSAREMTVLQQLARGAQTRKLPTACSSATRRSVPTSPGYCSSSMRGRWLT